MLKYKNFSLIKPNKSQSEKISQIIQERGGSIFHEVGLNEIVQRHFSSELFYIVNDIVNIKNFSPVHVQKGKFGLKRYHFKPLYDIPYAGFLDQSKIDFSKLSVGFFESYVYCGIPSIGNNKWINDPKILGQTAIIDLSLDEDHIFKEVIHSKRRNMIRKAMKSEIVIKKYFDRKGLDDFWPILNELHIKLGYNHLTKDYYSDILDIYGPKKQAFVVMAFKENVPISGIIVLGNKNYMMYYKGSSKFDIKNEGQGELLQWEAIKISKSLGIKYYDLGKLDKENLPSIYRFKTGISNNIVHYPICAQNSMGYKILNRIK